MLRFVKKSMLLTQTPNLPISMIPVKVCAGRRSARNSTLSGHYLFNGQQQAS
ncbi:hypothetical protein FOZG_18484 [Fusarium oxysporum Fo47]|nr:hypothetical protein FOZG_18484 [Fusarium oxysporum Fo47]